MFQRKPDVEIYNRISKLLKEVRDNSTYWGDALNTFINESIQRIDRVCRISNELNVHELKSKFLTQLEAIVQDRQKFTNHRFKTTKDSKVIDYDDFRQYMISHIPLLTPVDGTIPKAEDISYCKACIKDRREALIKKQNSYVGDELKQFIKDKSIELENSCNLIDLGAKSKIDVQLVFIEKLERFNFSEAYTRVGYQNKSQKFERTADGYGVDPDSFNKIVSNAISYRKPDDFISQALSISEQKNHFTRAIDEIENEIKKYSGSNKIGIINQFKNKMKSMRESFTGNIEKVGFFRAATDAKNEIDKILSKIQEKETKYYQSGFGFSFIANHCKSNSSLQPKINKAKETLEGIVIGAHRANPMKPR